MIFLTRKLIPIEPNNAASFQRLVLAEKGILNAAKNNDLSEANGIFKIGEIETKKLIPKLKNRKLRQFSLSILAKNVDLKQKIASNTINFNDYCNYFKFMRNSLQRIVAESNA